MTTEKLLPCPFCGESEIKIDNVVCSPKQIASYGECQGCGAQGAPRFGKNLAKKIWNTRVPINQWQPIETAPKDGQIIFGSCQGVSFPIYYQQSGSADSPHGWTAIFRISTAEIDGFFKNAFICFNESKPDFWMPLPK